METNGLFHSIEDAANDLMNGKIIIVVDDESLVNEGSFVALAEKATPEIVNFMIKEGRGFVCVPITEKRAGELELPPMVSNSDPYGKAFTVSIDHVLTTTGISALERSFTIRAITDPYATPQQFGRPGHIFPLIAKNGGVLRKPGHTEAAVDLAHICGAYPAAVTCEVMKANGQMARVPDLHEIAGKHDLKMVCIRDLIHYRNLKELLVKREAEVKLPTDYGMFKAIVYTNAVNDKEHIALVKGVFNPQEPVLVRVHSECLTGDVFYSGRCDCGHKLAAALSMINEAGKGVLLYLRQQDRGVSLAEKLRTYELRERGLDAAPSHQQSDGTPELSDYGLGAQILKDLGVQKIQLMMNNPRKIIALGGYGLEIVERVTLQPETNSDNIAI